MEHHRIDVGPNGKTYFRKRGRATRYLDSVPRIGAGVAYSEKDTYFVLEKALVNGTLRDPSLKWEATGRWIAPYQWDMLIYMWSNANIRLTSESFSGLQAAYTYTGLNRDIRGQRKEQGRRKRELFLGLERAGLMQEVRRSPGGRRIYRELKLAPVWSPNGPLPSDRPRTWANLSAPDRNWFKMGMRPFTPPSRKSDDCDWADILHVDRRALVALYLFYNGKEFGGVDPNHLCLRGNELVISDSFRKAVGLNADVDMVAAALGELWRRELFEFMTATFDEDVPHLSSPSHIRFATRVASSEDAIVGLRYVPELGDPGDADE